MAMPGNVIQDIALGVDDDERPSDAIYMCVSVATFLFSLEQDYPEAARSSSMGTPRSWTRMDRLLFGVGKVLCPIFDPLKLESLAEYANEMKSVRKSYRGIATDLRLRVLFDERAFNAARHGSFSSLRQAARDELPRRLWNPKAKGEGAF